MRRHTVPARLKMRIAQDAENKIGLLFGFQRGGAANNPPGNAENPSAANAPLRKSCRVEFIPLIATY